LAPHVEELLLGSVTVKVTAFGPTLVQLKLVLLNNNVIGLQASLDPLSTKAALVVPLPEASNITVTFWQLATGAMLSITVTPAVQVLLFEFTSVTVRVTVFGPVTWLQLNAVCVNDRPPIPQASVDVLFTKAALVMPLPVTSNITVTF
jgi:hypothetical protein